MIAPMSEQALELERVENELLARWPESRIEWKPGRMTALMDLMGDPQLAYPCVHIAGTNGKTSTSRMIDALLRALDLRTGRFTSPHLESITERIALDGEPISAARFVETYDETAGFLDLADSKADIRLSFFEAVTAMAFAAFADAPVDVAVVEPDPDRAVDHGHGCRHGAAVADALLRLPGGVRADLRWQAVGDHRRLERDHRL